MNELGNINSTLTNVLAGERGTWKIVYSAGSKGISVGGSIRIWSPQNHAYRLRYYEWLFGQVSAHTESVSKVLATVGTQDESAIPFILITVAGTPLVEGDRIEVLIGDTLAGVDPARAQTMSAREVRFNVEIDVSGSGFFQHLTGFEVQVLPERPESIDITIPASTVRNTQNNLLVFVKDRYNNICTNYSTTVNLRKSLNSRQISKRARIRNGIGEVTLNSSKHTHFRVTGEDTRGGIRGVSNPVYKGFCDGYDIFFGDLHTQSGYHLAEPARGTTKDLISYARDIAGLDFIGCGDFVVNFYRTTEGRSWWDDKKQEVAKNNIDGEFVTLLGYEWPSPYYGHRNVFVADDDMPIYRFSGSFAEEDPWWRIPTSKGTDKPQDLWKMLEGIDAITIPHHPNADTDRSKDEINVERRLQAWSAPEWDYKPNNSIETLIEIYQGRGSFETDELSPWVKYGGFGRSVQDWLQNGFKVGFVGGSDDHLCRTSPAVTFPDTLGLRGGITGVLAKALARRDIFSAMKSRRTYATNGVRMLLEFSINGVLMGGDLLINEPKETREIRCHVVGTDRVEKIELLRNNVVVFTHYGANDQELMLFRDETPISTGEYYYVRVIQKDYGIAWASPIWISTMLMQERQLANRLRLKDSRPLPSPSLPGRRSLPPAP